MSFLDNEPKKVTTNDDINDKTLLPFVNLRNTHLAALSALLYIIVVGMVNSYSAPATVDMQMPGSRFRDITPNEITWVASLPLISGVLGNCLSGYVTQKLGRKATLIFTSTSYVCSWLAIAYAPVISVIYIGRIISGFCAGICCVAVPAYVVEIAPTEIRGFLSSGFQVAFSSGVFLVMSLGIALRWSWLAISAAVLTTCAACFMVIMPESPPWLVRERRTAEALKGLKFLKGKNSNSKKELQDIIDNLNEYQSSKISVSDLRDPTFYKPVSIAVALMFFQQTSGINVIMSYTVEIFNSTGSSVNPGVASTIVAAVQVIGTILSSVLMDKYGRKSLFITSGTFMTLAHIVLGVYSFISRPEKHAIDLHSYGWIPLASLTMYIFSFSLGVGPIPFVMTPEMAPIRFRSTIIAIASLMNSLFSFIVTKTFEDMRTLLGIYGLYWTYSFFTFSSAIFGYYILPETKGLTLREIHRSFSRGGDQL